MNIKFNLNDERLNARADFCFKSLVQAPSLSFPQIFKKRSQLTGFYRLMNNSRVSPDKFMESIYTSVAERLTFIDKVCCVAHDTTIIDPACMDLPIRTHLSLLIDGSSRSSFVAGVGHLFNWSRIEGKKADIGEHARWFKGVEEVEKRFKGKKLIHLMDREGDSFENLFGMVKNGHRFVVRSCNDRLLIGEDTKLHAKAREGLIRANREIQISKRTASRFKQTGKIHPARSSREVKLEIAATKVEIKRSEGIKAAAARQKGFDRSLKLNIVCVYERETPEGEKPIEWNLLTTESIDTTEDILKVVDYYRKRWMVEEFFKCLKSGCKLEQRQFEGNDSFNRTLALLLAVSTNILNLKNKDENEVKELEKILTPTQLQILKLLASEAKRSLVDVRSIKVEIAHLGGYIQSNGPPGFIVLSRGMEELVQMERGWILRSNK